jgi:hypothetical protein
MAVTCAYRSARPTRATDILQFIGKRWHTSSRRGRNWCRRVRGRQSVLKLKFGTNQIYTRRPSARTDELAQVRRVGTEFTWKITPETIFKKSFHLYQGSAQDQPSGGRRGQSPPTCSVCVLACTWTLTQSCHDITFTFKPNMKNWRTLVSFLIFKSTSYELTSKTS